MFNCINTGECPCCAEKGGERGREWKKRKHLGKNLPSEEKNYEKFTFESELKKKYNIVHLGEKRKPLGKINSRRWD